MVRVKEKVTLARGKLLFQGASDPDAAPGGLESTREPSTSAPSEKHAPCAQKTGCAPPALLLDGDLGRSHTVTQASVSLSMRQEG